MLAEVGNCLTELSSELWLLAHINMSLFNLWTVTIDLRSPEVLSRGGVSQPRGQDQAALERAKEKGKEKENGKDKTS